MSAAASRPPLRVAQLVETLAVGGAERLALQIAAARARAGDRSSLLVLGGPGPLSPAVDPAVAVRYLDVERASILRPLRFAASLRRGLAALRAEVARGELQVVQSHLPNANFWGLLLALRERIAVLPTVHNNNEFHYGDLRPPRVRSRLRRLAYRLMLHRCAGVVAVSDQVASSLLREIGAGRREAARLHVVANGVSEPPPLPAAERERRRAGFGCRTDELLVLAAGRHSEQKNFRALIEAAALLRDRGVPCRTVIAGDGELRAQHRRRVEALQLAERVSLPGNLADLPQAMQAADVFVLPSLWEGLPLVLLEAMAAGTPVVGTDIDGIGEVVTHGETGLLCAADDPAALADALTRLRDPALRDTLGRAGLDLVRRRYSFERLNDQLGDLYRTVAAAGGPAMPRARA